MHREGEPRGLHPPRIGLQRSKLRGKLYVGSVQKLENTKRRRVCSTHAYENFDIHDASV